MPMRRLRTADYDEPARQRLADAVASARDAAGYRHRTEFARRADVSVRSIAALESAEPVVGQRTLWAVADALGWDKGMPKAILEGAEPPATGQATASTAAPAAEPEPGRIDVSTLIRQLLDGEPEPPDIGHLDIRDDFELEMIGLEPIPLLQRLTLIQIRRTRARGSSAGDTRPQRTA